MVKRFCKMNRQEIAFSLDEINQLVAASDYVCRSCARSSCNKANLCKPIRIEKAQVQVADTKQDEQSVLPTPNKKAFKLAKKGLKKQRKQYKKLNKLLKKQQKLAKKQQKLQRKFEKLTQAPIPQVDLLDTGSSLH